MTKPEMPEDKPIPQLQTNNDTSDEFNTKCVSIRDASQPHHHYKIFKPYGYLSQFVPERRKSKKLLAELALFPAGTMAIGRLDHDSEGLLLLTTDGMVSHQVRSKKVAKEYYVQVDGDIDDAAILKLQTGVEIGIKGEKYHTLPCKAFKLKNEPELPSNGRKPRDPKHGPMSWVSITISEGKNRQIRKMTAAAGFPTLRLVRVRIGNVHLDRMRSGEVIQLEDPSGIR
ncbi:pseudouridine synthase [Shewanella canadensis]|uniref:pseudouridine synthase n=1 Tax=Shewanella canadensis TaxID=271096 RepID=UPI001FE7AE20|nr:pseudouridine synthase [Shewanella canadensis]